MNEKETQQIINQNEVGDEKLINDKNSGATKSINGLNVKNEAKSQTNCKKNTTDEEYEEVRMVMYLDGKYDSNLLRSCISNGNYKLRKKDDGDLVVQVGHSVFNASFNETCGSDLLFPIDGNINDCDGEFGTPLTSDIRLICKKTNNPFFKDPMI